MTLLTSELTAKFPDTVKDALQSVFKKYYANNSLNTVADYMFVLSLKEVFGSRYNEWSDLDSIQSGSAVSQLGLEGTGMNNDEGYLFYESKKTRGELNASLTAPYNQWVRSVWLKSDGITLQPTEGIVIGRYGGVSGSRATDSTNLVKPAFCF